MVSGIPLMPGLRTRTSDPSFGPLNPVYVHMCLRRSRSAHEGPFLRCGIFAVFKLAGKRDRAIDLLRPLCLDYSMSVEGPGRWLSTATLRGSNEVPLLCSIRKVISKIKGTSLEPQGKHYAPD